MPDVFAIYTPDGQGILGPRPEPFTYFDLSIGAFPEGAYVSRQGDNGAEDRLYVYRDRTWVAWEPELGPQQKYAYDLALAGRSCFITGPGGVGKSEVMRRIVRDMRAKGRRIAVAASTGIAAVNIGGMTIHSTLGTGYASSIEEAKKRTGAEAMSKATDRFAEIDAILIDEVSMLHGDYMQMMSWWLKRIISVLGDPLRAKLPFGGFQMIFVGDFLQLPPVITPKDHVKYKYAFLAPAWIKANLAVAYLRKGYRQDDADFRKHLMRIRRGKCPQDTADYFNARHMAKLGKGVKATKILSTNKEVDIVNDIHLGRLEGAETSYEVTIAGHPAWCDAMRNNLACEEHLRLKVGAEVLFIKNNRALGYVNGTRGRVESLERGVFVRTYDGALIDVPREKWEMKNAKDQALAVAEQYPLLLAWACTTHRSQGSTLPYMAYDPSKCFERAMAYVALSRARSYTGLKLLNRLDPSVVRASKLCVDFYKNLNTEQEVQP